MFRKNLAAIPAAVLALLAWTASTHAGDALRLGGTGEDASTRTLELRPSDQADATPVHLFRRIYGVGYYRPFYHGYYRPYWGHYRPYWGFYRSYWNFYPGYFGYGFSTPVVGFNINLYRPYYYAPPVYYTPPLIVDPCCSYSTGGVVGTTSTALAATSAPVSTRPVSSPTTDATEILHAPTPIAHPTPAPRPAPAGQTFPYDRDLQPPVPLPRTQPAPIKTTPGGRVASQANVSKYAYAAYGEKPRGAPPAEDNLLPGKDRLAQKVDR